jgi:uncharacterized protein YcbX
MSVAAEKAVGSLVSLWRYPVKSMMGEEINAAELAPRGLLGDRAYAVIDGADGKVASAKNPRKWPGLFDFRAALVEPPDAGRSVPAARITLPDGASLADNDPRIHEVLSNALGRPVRLESAAPERPSLEEYWPDIEGLDRRDAVTDEAMPAGTFFDCAAVHLLTTTTLDRLQAAYPAGRFDARRFRPNLVVRPGPGASGFVENGWVGHTLAIGPQVRLRVTIPCGRCVMTTLAQGDLPADPGVLRTAARENRAQVGVYAAVVQCGVVRRGDTVRLED